MKANFDVIALAPMGTRISTTSQPTDMPSQGFGESLAAASKAASQTEAGNAGSTKSMRRPSSSSGDANQQSVAADGSSNQPQTQFHQAVANDLSAAQSPALVQQAAMPELASPAQSAQLSAPIFSAEQEPLLSGDSAVAEASNSDSVSAQPARNSAVASSTAIYSDPAPSKNRTPFGNAAVQNVPAASSDSSAFGNPAIFRNQTSFGSVAVLNIPVASSDLTTSNPAIFRNQTSFGSAAVLNIPVASSDLTTSNPAIFRNQTSFGSAAVLNIPVASSDSSVMSNPAAFDNHASFSNVSAGNSVGSDPTVPAPAVAQADDATPSNNSSQDGPPLLAAESEMSVASAFSSLIDSDPVPNRVAQNTTSGVQSGSSYAVLNAPADQSKVVPPRTAMNTAAKAVLDTMASANPQIASSAAPSVLQSSTAIQSAIEDQVSDAKKDPIAQTTLAVPASESPSAPLNASPSQSDDTTQTASPAVPDAVLNAVTSAAQNPIAGAFLNAVTPVPSSSDPASALRSVLNEGAKRTAFSVLSTVTPVRATLPSAKPANGAVQADSGVSAPVSANSVGRTQPSIGILATGQATMPGLNSLRAVKPPATTDATDKPAVSDSTASKQHTASTPDQTGSQASVQATASDDQSRSAVNSQGQNTVPVQANTASPAVHSTTEVQRTDMTSPVQNASAPSGGTAQVARASATTASAAPVAPQAAPVINTAKLVQTMGQSEMRVGMRSNEFGNISISTSSTRDLLSAQITLDHGELARTLAVHLPEVQAKLASYQGVDVRIDMNGATSGQNSGTSSSMQNGSADQSRGEGRQASSTASNYSGTGIDERQFSPVAAAIGTGDVVSNSRLDITV
jgi:hypothetical protein